MKESPYPENLCLSTLQETKGRPWSRKAETTLWDGHPVSPALEIDLPAFHQFREKHANRISISGVQEKISLCIKDGALIPAEADGQYLIKPVPAIPYLESPEDVPANEHVSMQAAARCFGIDTPPNGMIFLEDGSPAFIVKRFDRDPDSGAKRSQEDFCQLSNRTRATHGMDHKYDGSHEELGWILKQFCASYAIEIEKLFRLIVFHYVIGNGDAHFKNFSLVPTPFGDFVLSPAYDLINTKLHLPEENSMALDFFADDFESEAFRRHGFHTGADFVELAMRFEMMPARASRILERVESFPEQAEPLVRLSLLSKNAQDKYLAIIRERSEAVGIGL